MENILRQRIHHLSDEKRVILIQRLSGILQDRNEAVFTYLFGSFVEGLPFHDIDIGVYVSNIKEGESTLYSLDLAHILSKKIQFPVDVRVLNFAPVTFLYHVIRGKLILDKNEEFRLGLVERTIAKYLDLKPIARTGIREAFGR